MNPARILVVEDEEIAREYVADALRANGYETAEASTGKEAVDALRHKEFDVVISDIRMPDFDGLALLEHIKSAHPATEVIMATGYASIEDAVNTVKMGAYQYLAKPLRLNEMLIMVERAVEKRRIRVELRELKRSLHDAASVRIVGHSEAVRALKQQIRQVAPSGCTVLILGETGTGKELVARSLHEASGRKGKRFLAVNCATFTDELLAHELFGHEKAAFTGAYSTQKGLLEAADKGTFFLDEVGDMSLAMQGSLLRVLENRTLFRVGGTKEIPVDVRIIAATNKNLHAMVEEGTFRQDLLYRLNIITIHIPPLSERKEDIPLLANFFAAKTGQEMGKSVKGVDDKALALLSRYHFPGNIRELVHIMERAVILCSEGSITPTHLPPEVTEESAPCRPGAEQPVFVSLEENERRYLAKVLAAAGGSTGNAAKLLGINRGSLWRKLKRFGLADGS